MLSAAQAPREQVQRPRASRWDKQTAPARSFRDSSGGGSGGGGRKLYVFGVANRRHNAGSQGGLYFTTWRDEAGQVKERLESGGKGLAYGTFKSVTEAVNCPRLQHLLPFRAMSDEAWNLVPTVVRTRELVLPPLAASAGQGKRGRPVDTSDEDERSTRGFAFTQPRAPPTPPPPRKRIRRVGPSAASASPTASSFSSSSSSPSSSSSHRGAGASAGAVDGIDLAGYALVTDGSAGSRNGQDDASCGLGYVVAVLPHSETGISVVVLRGGVPGPFNCDAALSTTRPHTSPRAEWLAMQRGMCTLLRHLGGQKKDPTMPRLVLGCDNTGVVGELKRQLAKPRGSVVTDKGIRHASSNLAEKLAVVNLLQLHLRHLFDVVEVVHVPAHQSRQQQATTKATSPFMWWMGQLNVIADTLATKGQKEYDSMYHSSSRLTRGAAATTST